MKRLGDIKFTTLLHFICTLLMLQVIITKILLKDYHWFSYIGWLGLFIANLKCFINDIKNEN